MSYQEQLTTAMTMLGDEPGTIILGQAVNFPGTAMYSTFDGVSPEKRIEFPVAEDLQLGVAIGLSLSGYLPVCCYPRINFLLLALNQLVLHLDALPRYSDYRPKVIIRTAVASDKPLNPGPQHLGDYSHEIANMLRTVTTVRLFRPEAILPAYKAAMRAPGSTLLVEYMEHYDDE